MNSSYVHGGALTPLRYQTIGAALDETVRRFGDRDALVVPWQDVRWTWNQLGEKTESFAAGLLDLGFKPGDRLGIWAPNCWEWTVAQFATAKIGVVLVNINPANRIAELEYAINKVECSGLILAEHFKSSDYIAMIKTVVPELETAESGALVSSRLPSLRCVIRMGEGRTDGMYNFFDVGERISVKQTEELKSVSNTLQPDDPINIQFTSGTTGMPKGATLTHFSILNNGYFVGEAIKLNMQDRLCIPVPLYHCFGMVMGNLACVTHGAAMIYPSPSFEPHSVLKTIEQEKCTALYGVPTMFIAELDHQDFDSFDLSSLRTGIMAGSPCPIEVMKRVVTDMNMKEVTIAYGMTETSPVSFQSSVDDPIEKRVSTVGRIHPHVEVKIINDEGNVVPRGEQGELCTRGYNLMLGYWGDDEKTREAIDDAGWMHTGDLATIDGDGYCNITGRVKDMVIRGGENVYPREVEEFLYRHPDIQDVQVFGVPDDKYGEELCAWIMLRGGAEIEARQIQEYCKDQIAHYKIPRYVRFIDEFPMTVTGKVQKYRMREKMIAELGLTSSASS